MSAKDLARMTSHLLSRVGYGRETLIITRNGRPLAILAPIWEEPRPSEPADGSSKAEEAPKP